MTKRARPKVFPLAVLFAFICVSTLHAQTPLSLDDALRLAHAQASTYQTAAINEGIDAADLHLHVAGVGPATRRAAWAEFRLRGWNRCYRRVSERLRRLRHRGPFACIARTQSRVDGGRTRRH